MKPHLVLNLCLSRFLLRLSCSLLREHLFPSLLHRQPQLVHIFARQGAVHPWGPFLVVRASESNPPQFFDQSPYFWPVNLSSLRDGCARFLVVMHHPPLHQYILVVPTQFSHFFSGLDFNVFGMEDIESGHPFRCPHSFRHMLCNPDQSRHGGFLDCLIRAPSMDTKKVLIKRFFLFLLRLRFRFRVRQRVQPSRHRSINVES